MAAAWAVFEYVGKAAHPNTGRGFCIRKRRMQGLCHSERRAGAKRKATLRREQIQVPGTVSARNADICEGSETMSTTGREVRMIEQRGRAATQMGRNAVKLSSRGGRVPRKKMHAGRFPGGDAADAR